METVVGLLLLFFTIPIALLVGVFACEIVSALWFRSLESRGRREANGGVAVLIPAHNEGAGLLATLQDVKLQLRTKDRLLVVADNCTDDTAMMAKLAGAEVYERFDPARRGKGHALDFGVARLRDDPPEVVVIIDADCRVEPEAITRIASLCLQSRRPVQALYLMLSPDESATQRLAEFTWRLKNWARPLGLRALGLPCQLMGTGMAFPWSIISEADLATGHVAEDLKLGLELAEKGAPPLFCPEARVTSRFAESNHGRVTQRERWESGHLMLIWSSAIPRLLTAVKRGNLGLFALALDAAVPPLSLLGLLLAAGVAVTGAAAWLHAPLAPLGVAVFSVTAFVGSVVVAWHRFGRDLIAGESLMGLAFASTRKIPLYTRILARRVPSHWIRTARNTEDKDR